MSRRTSSVIPGFGLTLGYTLVYLSLIVLIPLAAMFIHAAQLTWEQFWTIVSAPRVLAALKLSFGTALCAALINGVIGTLLAWVLVRYTFPGRKIIDAMIDLPFALPTAVAKIRLTSSAVSMSLAWLRTRSCASCGLTPTSWATASMVSPLLSFSTSSRPLAWRRLAISAAVQPAFTPSLT